MGDSRPGSWPSDTRVALLVCPEPIVVRRQSALGSDLVTSIHDTMNLCGA